MHVVCSWETASRLPVIRAALIIGKLRPLLNRRPVICHLWSLQLAQLGLCINPKGPGFFSEIGLVILEHSLGYKVWAFALIGLNQPRVELSL